MAGIVAAVWWSRFLTWGTPYIHHPDEPAVMARALKMVATGELSPGWFRYPSLCLYLQAGLAGMVHWFTGLEAAPGAELLFEGARTQAVPFYVYGRGLTVAFAVGTTLVLMQIARRISGTRGALLAGAIFVGSALVQRSAIYVTVDMALTFFVAVSALLMLRQVSRPAEELSWRSFVPIAVAGGLAAGAKYNGALVLLVLAGVIVVRLGRGKKAAAILALCAGVSIVTFVCTTPYSVLDWSAFWSTKDGFPAELVHYRTGHFGADTGSSLLKAMGTLQHFVSPLLVLALGPLLLVRHLRPTERASVLVLAGVLVALGAPVVAAKVYFERNCVPLLVALIPLTCFGIEKIAGWSAEQVASPGAERRVASGVVVLVSAVQLYLGYEMLRPYALSLGRADPRAAMVSWVRANVPPRARILREAFSPQVHLLDGYSVTSCFAVHMLAPSDILGRYDYVVTSSAQWGYSEDLTGTTYAAVFAKEPLHEERPPNIQGFSEWPTVRIDLLPSSAPTPARTASPGR
jgi:4-amino-4-deoxy-L-arabinose transferase-like glycosyltransferase